MLTTCPSFLHHFFALISRSFIPAFSPLVSLSALSHGCCRHCWAVGRLSGSKSSMGDRKPANSRASASENLYLSTSNRSMDPYFSLLILFKSPYLSKYSLDRAPLVAILHISIITNESQQLLLYSLN